MEAKIRLDNLKQQGYRIIYLDEFCITKSTIPTHDWSLPNSPLKIDKNLYHKKTLACIIAISREAGFEMLKIYDKSVDTDKFIQFLKSLR